MNCHLASLDPIMGVKFIHDQGDHNTRKAADMVSLGRLLVCAIAFRREFSIPLAAASFDCNRPYRPGPREFGRCRPPAEPSPISLVFSKGASFHSRGAYSLAAAARIRGIDGCSYRAPSARANLYNIGTFSSFLHGLTSTPVRQLN